MFPQINKTRAFLTDFLYPVRCPGCDICLAKDELETGFCKSCSTKIKLAGKNTCMKCGVPLKNHTEEYCTNCEKTRHFFQQGKGIYRYSGQMKPAMYRFKYANKRCYGKIFARQAMKSYGKWIEKTGVQAIIPIPMYEKKMKKRGYNQAEVFAKQLGELTGLPILTKTVRRIRDTQPMKQLNNLERVKNLRKAFTIRENVVKFRKVMIIDDIYTTGSTMDAVAQELIKCGVENVYCLSICIGEMH